MSAKDDKSYELELLDDNSRLPYDNRRKAEVMVNPSRLPFANRLHEKSVRSYRKVVQETTGLLGDLKDHQRALNDLLSVDLDIEADMLAKEAHLEELREVTESNKQLKPKRQNIEELNLELQEAELEARLAELKKRKKDAS